MFLRWRRIDNKKSGFMSHHGKSGSAARGNPAEAPATAMEFHSGMMSP
jgi:hypothetical protein